MFICQLSVFDKIGFSLFKLKKKSIIHILSVVMKK